MCEEKISSYVWKCVVHEKDVCKKEVWKDFHDKAFGVLFQIVVPPKSIVGFVLNLKQLFFRKCRRFFSKFQHHWFGCKGITLAGSRGCL